MASAYIPFSNINTATGLDQSKPQAEVHPLFGNSIHRPRSYRKIQVPWHEKEPVGLRIQIEANRVVLALLGTVRSTRSLAGHHFDAFMVGC
jgi:hypothetical protein